MPRSFLVPDPDRQFGERFGGFLTDDLDVFGIIYLDGLDQGNQPPDHEDQDLRAWPLDDAFQQSVRKDVMERERTIRTRGRGATGGVPR